MQRLACAADSKDSIVDDHLTLAVEDQVELVAAAIKPENNAAAHMPMHNGQQRTHRRQ